MSDPSWAAVERYFEEYMKKHFVQTSVRREDEFNTIWYAAESEGGRRFLNDFMQQMEQEASKAIEN